MKKLSIQTHTGTPIEVDGITIQPISQSIAWIGRIWGMVWNRPYAIRVDDGEHTTQIPIVDLTRIALVFLWTLTGLFSLLSIRSMLKNRR